LWASVGAQPTERSLTLSRSGATVRIQEVGAGPLTVFVHGASNAGASWASLVARLGDLRCVLLDRPGCGLSPPLNEPLADMTRFARFADDLVVDVLDALEVADASVVGTSFGGYFALRAAAAHPDRITKVVELGWTFGAPVESTPLVMRIATQPFLGRLMMRIRPTERMVRSMLKQVGLRHAVESGSFGDVEMAWFLALLRHTNTMRNEIDASPRIMTMRGFNDKTLLPSSLLAQVTAPACFIWGEQDPFGRPALARTFTDQFPDARLELMPNAGHAPWIDDPDHVARRVDEFLRT
jgi:pimeloyl-ACP methyl ester carboxylesterase